MKPCRDHARFTKNCPWCVLENVELRDGLEKPKRRRRQTKKEKEALESLAYMNYIAGFVTGLVCADRMTKLTDRAREVFRWAEEQDSQSASDSPPDTTTS